MARMARGANGHESMQWHAHVLASWCHLCGDGGDAARVTACTCRFVASTGDRDLLTVETNRGASQTISTAKYGVTGRGGKGRALLQRGQFTRVIQPPVLVPTLDD